MDVNLRNKLRKLYRHARNLSSIDHLPRLCAELIVRMDDMSRHLDETQVKTIVVIDLGDCGGLEYWWGLNQMIRDDEDFYQRFRSKKIEGSYIWEKANENRFVHRGFVGRLLRTSSSPSASLKGRAILVFREYSQGLIEQSKWEEKLHPLVSNRLFADAVFSQAIQKDLERCQLT